MTKEEIIALSIKVKEGERAATELNRVADAAKRVGDDADRSSKKTQQSTSRWERVRGTLSRVRRMATLTGGALTAIGGAAVKQAVDLTKDMAKGVLGFSRVTGADVKTSAQWVEMAKLRGVNTRTLSMGMIALSKNMANGLKRGTEQNKMFRSLGVSLDTLKTSSPDQMFGVLAEKLYGVENSAKRNAIGAALMGRGYVKLGSLIAGGSKGLEENMRMVEGVGDAFAGAGKGKLSTFIKNMRQAQANSDALRITIGLHVMPILDKFVRKFTSVTRWMTKHKTETKILIGVLIALAVAIGIVNVALGILAIVEAVVAAPWILIVVAILAVIAIFVVLYLKVKWFRDGVNKVIGFIKKNWVKLIAIMAGPVGIIAYLIVKHWNKIIRFVKALPGKISRAASGMWDGIKSAFKSAINWIIKKWNSFRIQMKAVKIAGHTVVPGFTFDTPDIPLLAKGGTVRGVGDWISGEAGAEHNRLNPDGSVTVTPLSSPTTGAGRTPPATEIIEIDSPVIFELGPGGQQVIGRIVGRATADRKARLQGA